MKTEKYRARVHMLLLYPDCESHVKAIEKIKQSYDYAMILHDKDCDENGEVKKAHWHVVLRFNQAVWNSAIIKELGIESNYIEKVGNVNNALEYLVHYNEPDKYKYDLSEVTGTLRTKLAESIAKSEKTEGEKVIELIEFIESQQKKISVKDFARFCAESGYWAEFRRSGAIFMNIINEHNNQFNS